MPATQAQIGKGTTIGYGATIGGSFTNFAEVHKAASPKQVVADVKATHYTSPNGYHEYVPGWQEGGTVEFDANYTKSDRALAISLVGVAQYFKLTYPDGSTDVFPGYIKEVGAEIPNEAVITSKTVIKVTGPNTFTASS